MRINKLYTGVNNMLELTYQNQKIMEVALSFRFLLMQKNAWLLPRFLDGFGKLTLGGGLHFGYLSSHYSQLPVLGKHQNVVHKNILFSWIHCSAHLYNCQSELSSVREFTDFSVITKYMPLNLGQIFPFRGKKRETCLLLGNRNFQQLC